MTPERRVASSATIKLQLHDAIYRLRFCSNSLIHILSLSNSHNNVALIQKNRGDKSHRVIVALTINKVLQMQADLKSKALRCQGRRFSHYSLLPECRLACGLG